MNIEINTLDFWELISYIRGCRDGLTPEWKSTKLSVGDVFDRIRELEDEIPERLLLSARYHELKYDLIEGNTSWRKDQMPKEQAQVVEINSRLIHSTKKLISLAKS